MTVKIGAQTLDWHYFSPVDAPWTYTTPFYTREVDFTVPADGDYVLSFTQTGVVPPELPNYHPCSLVDDISVSLPDWMNNTLGIDDNVPAPWTPLVVSSGAIGCWNRNYNFGNSAFPTQITIGGANLLTGPIELRGNSSGQNFNWKNSVSSVTQTGQSKVTYSTTAHSAGIDMSVVKTVEFDGFMRIDVTLSPDCGTRKIDRLSLRIPVDKRYAKYRYGYGNIAGGGEGVHFPTEKDIVGALRTPWRSDFLPGLWIGDTSHGIAWYSESQKNWSQKLPNNAQTLESDGGSIVLQVNFIDTPVEISGPITLTFGMQATPVKPFPRPNNWLTYRPVECPGNKLFFMGWGGGARWGGYPVIGNPSLPITDPMAFDDTAFKASLDERHAQGLYLPMYLNAGTMVLDIPEVQANYQVWETNPVLALSNDMGQPMTHACPRVKDWQDLFLYRMNEFFSKYDLDAIYMDFGFLQRCDNALHGCGYDTADGRQGTWPIFAHRELHKRIYKILKKARPESALVTLGHPGGSLNLPHINFWDASVEGEYINVDIRGPVYEKGYTAFYSPERFAAEFSGRTFNSVPMSMFYTVNNNTQRTRTVFAMALAHGSIVWPAWIDLPGVVYPVYYALDRFGVADIEEFLPYWNNRGAVATDHAGSAYATVYKKKGKSLIVVSNLSENNMDVHVQIDPKVLGLKSNLVVKDLESEGLLAVQSSGATVSVPKKDFRLLVVSN